MFVENNDNIGSDEMLIFNNLFNNFYQEQKILISLYHNIEFSIIDRKL